MLQPPKPRHLKSMIVSVDTLAEMFKALDGDVHTHKFLSAGLPSDSVLVDYQLSPMHRGIVFTWEHPSFPEYHAGMTLEMFDINIEILEPDTFLVML